MKRLFKIGAGSLLATSTLATGLALAGPGAASATAVQRHVSSPHVRAAVCSRTSRSYLLPGAPTSYRAGSAGSVRIASVSSGTIRVVSVTPAKGYRAVVDSSSGSSVDVYFHHGKHTMKFEAEINDAGGLTILVTTC